MHVKNLSIKKVSKCLTRHSTQTRSKKTCRFAANAACWLVQRYAESGEL